VDLSFEFYDEETTTASFEELKKLLKFLEDLGTPHPAITGGWAVYAYEKGMGSRDIDIVMVSEADIIQHLYNHYFPSHDFNVKKIGLIPSHYEKIVQTNDGPRDIIVDVFDGEKEWKDEVNLGIKFHWNWTIQFQEKKEIDGLIMYVPKRELLIITKIMAAVARAKENDISPHYRLLPKILKDYRDVAVLTVGKNLDSEFYKEYMEKSNGTKYIDGFLARYNQPEYKQLLTDINGSIEEITSKLNI